MPRPTSAIPRGLAAALAAASVAISAQVPEKTRADPITHLLIDRRGAQGGLGGASEAWPASFVEVVNGKGERQPEVEFPAEFPTAPTRMATTARLEGTVDGNVEDVVEARKPVEGEQKTEQEAEQDAEQEVDQEVDQEGDADLAHICAICSREGDACPGGFVKKWCKHPTVQACRECLDRAMAIKFECPMCRRPLANFTEQEWKDAGNKDGQRTRKMVHGVYTGGWRANRPQGQGRLVWSDGHIYEGGFKHGNEDGVGRYAWPDGHIYEGGFKHGNTDGVGRFAWPDGAIYEGGFKHGQANGKGTYTFADGAVYEGIYTYAEAFRAHGKYAGMTKGGKAHGRGRMTKDGAVYTGEFRDGQADGNGKYISAAGDVYEGRFKGGKPDADGKTKMVGV